MNVSLKKPLISIIIVNWNGEHYLHGCLDSISINMTLPFEVILVDNNSSDGSVASIKRVYPWVRLIKSGKNLGFSKGNNLGVQHAKGKYLLLLNNDTVLCGDIIPALNLLARQSDIGAVGAKMLSAEGHYRYSAGHFPHPHRLFKISTMFRKEGYFKVGNFPLQHPGEHYPVDYVEGSFLLVRKKHWLTIGGFDPAFFMYGEDVEFCYRLKDHGLKTVYMPGIEYIHLGGFTYDREHLVIQGILTFHKKWSGLPTQSLVYSILAARLLARYVVYRFMNRIEKFDHHKAKADASLVAMRKLLGILTDEPHNLPLR